ARLVTVGSNQVSVSRDRVVTHYEADQGAQRPPFADARQGGAPPELALLQLDRQAHVGLVRVVIAIQLVAVQRHAGLEPEGVAAAQTAGLDPEGLARGTKRLPQGLRLGRKAEELEAVFPGVAGARDEAFDPGDRA